MDYCPHIDQIVKLAKVEGNKIFDITKSELMSKVLWMNNVLSNSLRKKILSYFKNLNYKKTKDMPHNASMEYFVCQECKVVVVFPI